MIVVLLLVAIVGLAGASAAGAAFSFAQSEAKHAAQHYAVLQLQHARVTLQRAIAQQVQSGGPAGPFAVADVPPAPLCADVAAPCALYGGETFALEAASGWSSATLTALQTQTALAEDRVAARMTVTVTSARGVLLAARTQRATVRTFAAPPYALVAGVADAAGGGSALEADSGGCNPAQMTQCDPGALSPGAAPTPFSDTRIHALLVCRENGNGGSCAGATPRPADAFADRGWRNGNVSNSGWTP